MSLYSRFLEDTEAGFLQRKTQFEEQIKNARDENVVVEIWLKDLQIEYDELSFRLSIEGLGDFFDNWHNEYLSNKDHTDESAFSKTISQYDNTIGSGKFELLVKYKCINQLFEYLDSKFGVLQHKKVETHTTPIWIDDNQTSFLQLIEGLIDLKYISPRPNQGKEKLIMECAGFFGIKLSKNWKSNLSKSKNERNSDYVPKIFRSLVNIWR